MKAVVIGASTGGPPALEELLKNLPKDILATIIVVQHLPLQFTLSMSRRLAAKIELPVNQMAESGDFLKPGHVYVAPGQRHFLITSPGYKIQTIPSYEKTNPSIDIGFTSVAEHFGPETIGVVLTGMGNDGVIGCKAIKQVGGHVIAQDEDTSAVYGMPKAVAIAGFADEVLPLNKIAARLVELVSKNLL